MLIRLKVNIDSVVRGCLGFTAFVCISKESQKEYIDNFSYFYGNHQWSYSGY